jgi:hypothetical protein
MDVTIAAAGYSQTGSGSYAIAGWNHFAMVRESVTLVKGYLNGAPDATLAHPTVAGRAASTKMSLGQYDGSGDRFDGRVQAVKAWDVALNESQILSELVTYRPVHLFNIWAWWPMLPGSGERHLDYSGNGRHWTEVGTLSDEDPKDLAWGGPALAVIESGAVPPVLVPRYRTLMGVGT